MQGTEIESRSIADQVGKTIFKALLYRCVFRFIKSTQALSESSAKAKLAAVDLGKSLEKVTLNS